MSEFRVEIQNVTAPSPKVLLMYRAVSELLREKKDVSSVKVSDITTKAGIGKGTAYEYFSSKEDIIANAMLYEYSVKFAYLRKKMDSCGNFRDKFFCILYWLDENREYNLMFSQLIRLLLNGEGRCSDLKEQIPLELRKEIHDYVFRMTDALLEEGHMEGLYTETDTNKRRLAFLSSLAGYAFVVMEPQSRLVIDLDQEQTAVFCYETFVKALN